MVYIVLGLELIFLVLGFRVTKFRVYGIGSLWFMG